MSVDVGNASLRCAKTRVGMKVKDTWVKRVNCFVLYHESPTLEELVMTSKPSTSLPVVSSDSWVRPLCWRRLCIYTLRDSVCSIRTIHSFPTKRKYQIVLYQ